MSYIVVEKNGNRKSYVITSTADQPRLGVGQGYIPLVTGGHASPKIKVSAYGMDLEAGEYQTTSVRSTTTVQVQSYYGNAGTRTTQTDTYYSSAAAKGVMSNTTALTSSNKTYKTTNYSTYATRYLYTTGRSTSTSGVTQTSAGYAGLTNYTYFANPYNTQTYTSWATTGQDWWQGSHSSYYTGPQWHDCYLASYRSFGEFTFEKYHWRTYGAYYYYEETQGYLSNSNTFVPLYYSLFRTTTVSATWYGDGEFDRASIYSDGEICVWTYRTMFRLSDGAEISSTMGYLTGTSTEVGPYKPGNATGGWQAYYYYGWTGQSTWSAWSAKNTTSWGYSDTVKTSTGYSGYRTSLIYTGYSTSRYTTGYSGISSSTYTQSSTQSRSSFYTSQGNVSSTSSSTYTAYTTVSQSMQITVSSESLTSGNGYKVIGGAIVIDQGGYETYTLTTYTSSSTQTTENRLSVYNTTLTTSVYLSRSSSCSSSYGAQTSSYATTSATTTVSSTTFA